MFSNNNRISTRQVFRLFVFDFVGESTLILPSQLAAFAGNDGLASIVLGGIMGSLYLWYLAYVLKKMETDLVTYMERILPTWMKKIFLVLLLVYFTGMAGYGAYIFSDVIQKGLIAGESFPLILILVLLTAGYAVCGGIESRARVYEILFVRFVCTSCSNAFDCGGGSGDGISVWLFSGRYRVGDERKSGSLFLSDAIVSACIFSLLCAESKMGEAGACRACGNVVCIGVLAVLYVILLGSFGSRSLTTMKYPAITLMSSIHLRGSFLKLAGCLYDRHLVFYAVCTCDCVFVLCTGTGTETAEKRYA